MIFIYLFQPWSIKTPSLIFQASINVTVSDWLNYECLLFLMYDPLPRSFTAITYY